MDFLSPSSPEPRRLDHARAAMQRPLVKKRISPTCRRRCSTSPRTSWARGCSPCRAASPRFRIPGTYVAAVVRAFVHVGSKQRSCQCSRGAGGSTPPSGASLRCSRFEPRPSQCARSTHSNSVRNLNNRLYLPRFPQKERESCCLFARRTCWRYDLHSRRAFGGTLYSSAAVPPPTRPSVGRPLSTHPLHPIPFTTRSRAL